MKQISPWLVVGCLSLIAASCQSPQPTDNKDNSPACTEDQGYTKDTSKQESFSDEQTKAAPQVVDQAAEKAAEPAQKVEAPAAAPQAVEPVVERPAAPAAPAEQPVVEAAAEATPQSETVQK